MEGTAQGGGRAADCCSCGTEYCWTRSCWLWWVVALVLVDRCEVERSVCGEEGFLPA